jgi:hypothetical protein
MIEASHSSTLTPPTGLALCPFILVETQATKSKPTLKLKSTDKKKYVNSRSGVALRLCLTVSTDLTAAQHPTLSSPIRSVGGNAESTSHHIVVLLLQQMKATEYQAASTASRSPAFVPACLLFVVTETPNCSQMGHFRFHWLLRCRTSVSADLPVTFADVARAQALIRGGVVNTPCSRSYFMSKVSSL